MTIAPGFVGIDVGKHYLDIFAERPIRIANSCEAIAGWLADQGPMELVLLEATGRYDRRLRSALMSAGQRYCRVNPAQARAFARATGHLAKTDRVDARMLALMAQVLRPHGHVEPGAEQHKLGELNARRDQLVDMRRSELNRSQEIADPDALADIKAHIRDLSARIAAFELRIAALIETVPALERLHRLLRSIPGIGPVAATTLMALLPEAGQRSPKTIAALCGLAPINNDSGTLRGKRSIRGGRARVRTALYMAALSATRSTSPFATRFKAMLKAGKPAKLALIAIARKLVVIANAVVRDNTPYSA
jgi:transposase